MGAASRPQHALVGLHLLLGAMPRVGAWARARPNDHLRAPGRARGFTSTGVRMMPEGPEVKHLADSIAAVVGGARFELVGARIVSGRYLEGQKPTGWEELQARLPLKVEACSSRGKFMYWALSDGCSLWSTLGLTGWWSCDMNREHTRVVLTARSLEPSSAGQPLEIPMCFADMRNFGTLRFSTVRSELNAKLAALGVPWLDGEVEWPRFRELVAKTVKRYPTRPVAVFLMDQSKTAGVGNYILSEALYRAKVDPFAECGALDVDTDWAVLHGAIADVMGESFAAQGRDWRQEFRLRVYSKKEDPDGRPVTRAVGPHKRGIWFVPELQLIGLNAQARQAAGAASLATGPDGDEM
mmetsp:Transcript_43497/g.107590  ORF Transcript_43497/g.107590 Transcript_43497/m.107590 type:complete len:354 (-) Transcript_43497:64-1125(-)